MAEKEATDHERMPDESASESRERPKRQIKAMLAGGVILIVVGIALTIYMAVYEDGPILIALGPAFIGIMIVMAALFGKKI